jgi:hypothetical protein
MDMSHSTDQKTQPRQVIKIISFVLNGLLILALVGAIVYFSQQNNRKDEQITGLNQAMNDTQSQVATLTTQQTDLSKQLTAVQTDFDNAKKANDQDQADMATLQDRWTKLVLKQSIYQNSLGGLLCNSSYPKYEIDKLQSNDEVFELIRPSLEASRGHKVVNIESNNIWADTKSGLVSGKFDDNTVATLLVSWNDEENMISSIFMLEDACFFYTDRNMVPGLGK